MAIPIARLLEFGKCLRISGTSTLLFADGGRVSRVIAVEELERCLSEATSEVSALKKSQDHCISNDSK